MKGSEQTMTLDDLCLKSKRSWDFYVAVMTIVSVLPVLAGSFKHTLNFFLGSMSVPVACCIDYSRRTLCVWTHLKSFIQYKAADSQLWSHWLWATSMQESKGNLHTLHASFSSLFSFWIIVISRSLTQPTDGPGDPLADHAHPAWAFSFSHIHAAFILTTVCSVVVGCCFFSASF